MPSRSRTKKALKFAKVEAKKNAKSTAHKAVNPFEVKVNRRKHNVLGQRKNKADSGLPGVSRSRAIQKRKKTLLVEHKQKNKSNLLLDRRFGEGEEDLSVEEKVMQRFILERKRKHERSSLFNLNDDNVLTHYGQAVGEMDLFDEVKLSDEEEVEEDIGETHFGGFMKKKRPLQDAEEEEAPPKTRKQILDEIVAKSKILKHERQSEKMEVEDLMEKVDTDWKSIHDLLPRAEEETKSSKPTDGYDKSVRELQFERRGQALDRMKTEEEIIKEEKEHLERLEADRVRRMKGLSSDGGRMDCDAKMSADFMADPGAKKKADKRVTLHYEDGRMVLGNGEGGVVEGSSSDESRSEEEGGSGEEGSEEEGDEEGSGVEEVEEEDGEEEDEEDGSEEEIGYGSDLDISEGEDDEIEEKKEEEERHSKDISLIRQQAGEELPYTFAVPKSLADFCSIVEHRTPEECLTAVERIHTCNHPSISPSNKDQLEAFLGVLLDYCVQLGKDLCSNSLRTLDKLVCPLYKLAKLDAQNAAIVFLKELSMDYQKWTQNRQKYPSFSTLLVFQLSSVVFPASDYQHPVTTPTLSFMCQILAQSKVKSVSDFLRGLLLCSIVLGYIRDSRRFVPELVNFLTSAVGCFSKSSKCAFLPPFSAKSRLRAELSKPMGEVEDLSGTTLLEMLVASAEDRWCTLTFRCDLLQCALDMVSQLVSLYHGLHSFLEILSPLQENLMRITSTSWPSRVMDMVQASRDGYTSLASRPRDVLQMLKQKPKSIQFYEPKFDETYEIGRKQPRVKSAVREHQKLKYKLKRETKGAVREIRKDAAFLSGVKLQETLLLDSERQRKTRQLMHELQTQQHEAKVERLRSKKR